jgi:integrase
MMALFRYPRRKTWWYDFRFAGQQIRESARTRSKELARRAEQARRRELEEGYHGLKKRAQPRLFSVAAGDWLAVKSPHWAAKSLAIERNCLAHLMPVFGTRLLTDIEAIDISRYQQQRRAASAAPKSVNLEVGTLRAILRHHRLWADLQPDVGMLPTTNSVGQVLSAAQERSLMNACGASRSRSLLPAVALALNTGMRYSEIRLLKWGQIDSAARTVTVGNTKTKAGSGRVIPLNDRVAGILTFWADQFPNREVADYVFPQEAYGAGTDAFTPCAHHTDSTAPIGSWKTAWQCARRRAGLSIRFHDLRHSACTRMLEAGVPLSVIADLFGWSAATTTKMAKLYGHIGDKARRQAVDAIGRADFGEGSCAFPFDMPSAARTSVAN